MWIPTHYVVLFIAILLAESSLLFVYTIIGLIKQNPMPFLFPPEVPQYPLCQYAPKLQQPAVRQGTTPLGESQPLQQPEPVTSTAVVTSISILRQMLSTAPNGEIVTIDANNYSPGDTIAMATAVTPSSSRASDTAPSTSDKGTSSSATTSSSSSSSSASSTTDTAKVSSTTMATSRSSSTGSSSSDVPHISTFTNKAGVVTSVVLSTTTLPAKPQHVPTITSVLVLPASESPK